MDTVIPKNGLLEALGYERITMTHGKIGASVKIKHGPPLAEPLKSIPLIDYAMRGHVVLDDDGNVEKFTPDSISIINKP